MVPKSLEMTSGPRYHFISSQMTRAVPIPKGTSLVGQTGILTGGNTGIGYATAESLLDLNLSRLIIAVRTPSKGEAAAAKLREKHKNANVEVWQIDMLSHKSVQSFAARCQTLDRIDFAILNAGTTEQHFKLGPEGHENMYQVNYLSTVLLAHLLLPTLKAKAPAGKPGRLTIVNSGTSHMTKMPNKNETPFLPTFDDKSKFTLESYFDTKAVAHFWIVKLVERVKAEDVIVNLVDPGLVKGTELHRNTTNPIFKGIMSMVKSITGRTMAQGASTLIDAVAVKGKESHGSYIMDWAIWPYTPVLYTPEGKKLIDKVWDETLAELSFANVKEILASL